MASPHVCGLCQENVDGQQSDEVSWRCGHKVHMECFGSWVHSEWPGLDLPPLPDSGISCPICRSPWESSFDEVLAAKLRILGKTFQNFSDHGADQEMAIPPSPERPSEWLVPLCCPRLLCTGGDGEPTTFVELAYDRRMTWMGGMDYECLRCGSRVSDSMPEFNNFLYLQQMATSHCLIHGLRSMIVDRQTNRRWWTCVEHYPEDDVPMPLQNGCIPIGPLPDFVDMDDVRSNGGVSEVTVIDVDEELPEPAMEMEPQPQPDGPAEDAPQPPPAPEPAEDDPQPQPADDELDEDSRSALLRIVCSDELDALSRLARDD